jgi:hypothetical protein
MGRGSKFLALPLPTYTYARAKVRLPEIAHKPGAAVD